MNIWTYSDGFFQSVITSLQGHVYKLLETSPAYIMVMFASWPNKALIFLEYYLPGEGRYEVGVKLYNHPQLLCEIELFKQTFVTLQMLCP